MDPNIIKICSLVNYTICVSLEGSVLIQLAIIFLFFRRRWISFGIVLFQNY